MQLILLSTLFLHFCDGYRILLVFPFPFKSHGILGAGFVRNLMNAGHEVTYITPFPLNNTDPKLHQIKTSSDSFLDHILNIKPILENTFKKDPKQIFSLMKRVSEITSTNVALQTFLQDTTQKFDLAILEWMDTEIYSGFSAVFDCPFIWFFPYDQYLEIFRLIHTIPSTVYTPNIRTNNMPPFSFQQRVHELWYLIVNTFYKKFYFSPAQELIYKNFFGSAMKKRGKELPEYDQIRYNASLAFSNSHISLRDIPEMPKNLKMIGGFHIQMPVEPLPKNLQDIMDKSKQGVVLFSMGTQLTSAGLPTLVSDLIETFRKLKYTVLWKTEEKNLSLPRNVIAKKWIPQVSVLAHPNCVLFVTHGGILSIAESVHFSVPIIGIPAFADQFINVRTAVKNGFAIEVKLSLTMGRELLEAITEIMSNPRYAERAREVSQIYHSRLVPPAVELVHWVEHVVKTRGAPHLRSLALHMPLYQKCYLDLLAVVLVLLTALTYVVRKIFRSLLKHPIHNRKKNN